MLFKGLLFGLFFMNMCFQFFWVYIHGSGIAGSCNNVEHLQDLPNCFPKWLHHFDSPPAILSVFFILAILVARMLSPSSELHFQVVDDVGYF